MSKRTRAGPFGVLGVAAALAAGLGIYPVFFRRQCLTWGARPDEVSRKLPGGTLVMEPGSLIMERKMLLGIKERAEDLARAQIGGDGR